MASRAPLLLLQVQWPPSLFRVGAAARWALPLPESCESPHEKAGLGTDLAL